MTFFAASVFALALVGEGVAQELPVPFHPASALPAGHPMLFGSEGQAEVKGLNAGVGRGYDIVSETHRAPLFTWSYDLKQTWFNPYTGLEERIPDEMYLTNEPTSWEASMSSIQNSMKQYEHTKASTFGIDGSVKIDDVDLSASFKRSKKEADGYLRNGTAMFSFNEHITGFYTLETWYGVMPFSPQFDMLVQKLPKSLSNDEDAHAYKKFFDVYGTHVVTGGLMGGIANFTTSFDNELMTSHSEKWVSQQMSLSITWEEIHAGIDSDRESSTDKVDDDFESHSRTQNQAVGGDPTVLQGEGFPEWTKTLASNPALILRKSSLLPMHDVVDDEALRPLLLKALKTYIESGGEKVI